MTKRLAVFLPGLYGGGAERTMLNLADGFTQRNISVDLVVGVVDGPLQDQIPDSVRYVPLHARRTLTVLPALVDYLRRECPDAMLTALNRANLMGVWAKRLAWLSTIWATNRVSTRVVISERNTLSAEAQHGRKFSERLYPLLARIFYPWADGIVAVSDGVASDLANAAGLAPQRIATIYNPVVTSALVEKAQQSLSHPWFGAEQPDVILGVGRLSEQKDFATLIRAFAQLRKSRVDQVNTARLLILGEGPKRPELEALIEQLGLMECVSMPGWVTNPVAFMREARLFVLCSQWEGLPGVLIEALYAGAPIIATDTPGGSDEVLGHGRYGALIPVGDVDALANAIKDTLLQPRRPPPAYSWQPYEQQRVMAQYADILLL